jgi:hypothetical protein
LIFLFFLWSNLEFTLSCTCLQVHIHYHIIFNGCILSKILCTKGFSTTVGDALRRPSIVTNLLLVQDCPSQHPPRSAFKASTCRTYLCCSCSFSIISSNIIFRPFDIDGGRF